MCKPIKIRMIAQNFIERFIAIITRKMVIILQIALASSK